ncbi:MAG: hypothetical protein AB4290_04640 [Spirulina sp.]
MESFLKDAIARSQRLTANCMGVWRKFPLDGEGDRLRDDRTMLFFGRSRPASRAPSPPTSKGKE